MSLWQIFSQNGEPVEGKSATGQDFAPDSGDYVKAGSHIWIWTVNEDGIKVLLQKRAASKPTWSGYYDISAAGHVDADESFIETAVRETKEELGISVIAEKLVWIFACRPSTFNNEIDHVYMYKVDPDTEFNFSDGEVESVTWHPLAQFKDITASPEQHNIVPHADHYFQQITEYLQRQD